MAQICNSNPARKVDASALPAFLTVQDAAEVCNVPERSMRNMCSAGAVQAVKIGGRWRVNRDALLAKLGMKAL